MIHTLLTGLCLSTAVLAQTVINPVNDYFTVDFNVPNGVADSTNGSSTNLVVGRLDNGNLARGILVFELPDMDPADIQSVTLDLDYTWDSVSSAANNADLYHSVSFNTTVPSILAMFGDPSNPPDPFTLAVGGFVSDGTGFGLLNIDVTSQVVADLTAEGGSAVSAFRIQLQDEVVAAGERYMFAQLENTNFATPTLTITTAVPEPGTFALLAGGLALGLMLFRRR